MLKKFVQYYQRFTYFLAYETILANGFSHVYILMTCIPAIISFIKRTRSSVLIAVRNLKLEVFFPNQAAQIYQIKTKLAKYFITK